MSQLPGTIGGCIVTATWDYCIGGCNVTATWDYWKMYCHSYLGLLEDILSQLPGTIGGCKPHKDEEETNSGELDLIISQFFFKNVLS